MTTDYLAGFLDANARIYPDGRIRLHGRPAVLDAVKRALYMCGHREAPTRYVITAPTDQRSLLNAWKLGTVFCDEEIDAALDRLGDDG